MIQDPVFYLLAAPAAILLGFAKGGLAGVGSLAGSTFAGVWLVRRIDGERFYKIIYWLMIFVGVLLIGEAAL